MVHIVHVLYTRDLAHPVDRAFAWLTDYDDRDHARAGAIIKRRTVVERRADRVLLEGQLEAFGRSNQGRAEVLLFPPDHWRAHLVDRRGRQAGVYDYRLEPRPAGSRLVVDYGFAAPKMRHRLLFLVGRRRLRRELDKMWDGFVAAMDAELAR